MGVCKGLWRAEAACSSKDPSSAGSKHRQGRFPLTAQASCPALPEWGNLRLVACMTPHIHMRQILFTLLDMCFILAQGPC